MNPADVPHYGNRPDPAIGEGRSRAPEGGGRVRVAAAVIVENGKVLLAHRFPHVHLPDLWEFPGGKLEDGETPEACAIREVREELGIEIAVDRLLLRRPYDYADRKVDLWFFAARRLRGSPRPIHCSEFVWVAPEDVASYPLPDASTPVIDALRDAGLVPNPTKHKKEEALAAVTDRKHATIIDRRCPTPDVVELTLRPSFAGGLAFRAGQYLMVEVEKGKSRPYSIASAPSRPMALQICFHRIPHGEVSNYLAEKAVGDDVCFTGPHGRFVLREESARDVLMVAGGTGVTPLRSMILDMLDRRVSKRIDLLFGCRTDRDLIYEEEFRHLESHFAHFRYHATVSRDAGPTWTGHRGRVTAILPRLLPDLATREAYVCGPPAMVTDVIDLLVRSGLDRANLHREGD